LQTLTFALSGVVIPHIKNRSGNSDDQLEESVQHGKKVASLSVSLESFTGGNGESAITVFGKVFVVELCVVSKIKKTLNFVVQYSIVIGLKLNPLISVTWKD
jgi:hypothetical protein